VEVVDVVVISLPLSDFPDGVQENGLRQNAIVSFPSDLSYVLRSIQLLRGMATHMNVDYSLAHHWSPLARELLENGGPFKNKVKGKP